MGDVDSRQKERCFGAVRFIPGGGNGRYPHCNSLYVEGAEILIDPGAGQDRLARLRRESGVESVWLSHYHDDHIHNLNLFGDVPLYMSRDDAPPLAGIDVYLDWYQTGAIEESREYWRGYLTNQVCFRPRTPSGILRGGDRVRSPGVTIDIISTPGHTGGHLGFYFREEGVLFLGDYDLSSLGPVCADPQASFSDSIRSVRLLQSIPARVWVASHGAGVFEENPGPLWDAYLDAIENRECRILDALSRPMTVEEIADLGLVYGHPNRPRGFYINGERGVIRKHLIHMLETGRVRRDGTRFIRG